MNRRSFAEKVSELNQLREQAHRKVDTLTRQQLRRFLKRNSREWTAETQEQEAKEKS